MPLANNNLEGTIPSSLGSLTNLYHMNLNNNSLEGTIPSSLGSLTKLYEMYLNNNSLTGTILSSLGSITNLYHMSLNNNRLNGTIPSSLGSLRNLGTMELANNSLTGTIPSSLGSITYLHNIKLSGNALTGLVPPLPFKQYDSTKIGEGCQLDEPGACTEPNCNHFKCPLPAGSEQCKYYDYSIRKYSPRERTQKQAKTDHQSSGSALPVTDWLQISFNFSPFGFLRSNASLAGLKR
jgi:Leucine-rich repeat (LRR) protein